MLADVGSATNGQIGTWVIILFAVIPGASAIITIFSLFATRREVDRIDQRVTELERTDTTIRAEMREMKDALICSAERRSAVLHSRLNPVVEALAELKGTNEALLVSFNNVSIVMKEGLETLRRERK